MFREPRRAKPTVALGYAASTVEKLVLSFVRELNTAAVMASFERVGKSVRTPPRDAILAGLAGNGPGLVFKIHRTIPSELFSRPSGGIPTGQRCRTKDGDSGVLGFLVLFPLLPVEEKLPEEG